MSTVTAKIKEEFLAMLPPTIFFFVALHIVSLVRSLMLKGTGLAPATTISVTVAALILGKAVLIADMLPIINRYPDKPLIYNVAWKTLIYFVVSGIIHYLERLYDFWREAGGFVAGNEKLLAEIVWPHYWAIADRPVRADPDVLHDSRDRTRAGRRQVVADVLRTAAGSGNLSGIAELPGPAFAWIAEAHHACWV